MRRYRVYRPTGDPRFVLVDLELDRAADADALLVRLQALWGRVEGKLMSDARARVLEVIESHEY
ncbi:MAG: hypothetical protein U0263_41910 [Polyangiaceae bacterium]